MKILAHIPKGHGGPDLLVQMTREEAARIIGLSGYIGNCDGPERVGHSFDVGKAWELIQEHAGAKRRLADASRTLRALADLCDQQAPTLIAPIDERIDPKAGTTP